ncbi:MAG: polysaccharide biosynthesis C-terminal domain-containing protein, partial [Gemmatimonadaceae bacterium]
TVIGENRRTMQINVAGAIIMPIAFYAGSHWGTVGLAAGWLLVYPIVVVAPMASLVFRRIELSPAAYFRALLAPFTSAALMCVAVWMVRFGYPAEMPRVAMLATDIAVGALTYGGSLLLLHGARVRAVVSAIRAARAGNISA